MAPRCFENVPPSLAPALTQVAAHLRRIPVRLTQPRPHRRLRVRWRVANMCPPLPRNLPKLMLHQSPISSRRRRHADLTPQPRLHGAIRRRLFNMSSAAGISEAYAVSGPWRCFQKRFDVFASTQVFFRLTVISPDAQYAQALSAPESLRCDGRELIKGLRRRNSESHPNRWHES